MKHCLVFLSLFILSSASLAKSRLDLSMGARSFPKGLSLKGTAGYSFEIWRERGGAGFLAPHLYGEIRPELSLATSAKVNTATGQLRVFPISLLELYVGISQSHRNVEIDTLDCNLGDCGGALGWYFYGSKLSLGYSRIFNQFSVEISENFSRNSSLELVSDHQSNLYRLNSGETLFKLENIVGFELTPKWSANLLFSRSTTQSRKEWARFWGFFPRYEEERWSGLIGVGVFSSSHAAERGSLFTSVGYRFY